MCEVNRNEGKTIRLGGDLMVDWAGMQQDCSQHSSVEIKVKSIRVDWI